MTGHLSTRRWTAIVALSLVVPPLMVWRSEALAWIYFSVAWLGIIVGVASLTRVRPQQVPIRWMSPGAALMAFAAAGLLATPLVIPVASAHFVDAHSPAAPLAWMSLAMVHGGVVWSIVVALGWPRRPVPPHVPSDWPSPKSA